MELKAQLEVRHRGMDSAAFRISPRWCAEEKPVEDPVCRVLTRGAARMDLEDGEVGGLACEVGAPRNFQTVVISAPHLDPRHPRAEPQG